MTSITKQKSIDDKSILTFLYKYLDELGYDSDELCCRLMNTGALLSGSFLLQCILQTKFTDSFDIDIFVPSCRRNIEEWKEVCNIDLSTVSGYNFEPIKQAPNKQVCCCDCHKPKVIDEHIVSVYKSIVLYKIPINIIFVYTDNLFAYINKTFDIDICKNTFDGTSLHITPTLKVQLPNIEPINFFITPNIYHKKTNERIKKYIKRGFVHKEPISKQSLFETEFKQMEL